MPPPIPGTTLLQRLVSIEALLVQIVFYLALWLIDTYMAKVVCLLIGGISLALLLVALLIELVDRSRVPKVYYRFMLWCCIGPAVGGVLGWLMAG